ncbi:uncharacterized protein LOC135807156 [Sycon ciliatum]|uniref:uncharacterized protein LOC135807156 n=1 Tax=Sycon ciliatum TaxID=27933 RepID=UPI0031F70237
MAVAQRLLGRTGIHLPALGFGAAPLGQKFYKLTGDPKETVDAALKCGVNYFDTSPYYGASEETLGKALQGHARDSFIVSTKLGRIGQDKFDFSPSWVEKSVENSLKLLGLSYIDILFLHDVEFLPDTRPINEESLPALQRLQKRGLVKAIGFSCYPLETVRKVLAGPNADLVDVVLTYAHNNLLDDSLQTLHAELEQKGVGLIDASPLALGLLRDEPPPDWHKSPQDLRKECQTIASELSAQGLSLQAVALKHAMQTTPGASLLIGMASPDQVRQNVEVLQQAKSKQYSEIAEQVKARLAPWKGVDLS